MISAKTASSCVKHWGKVAGLCTGVNVWKEKKAQMKKSLPQPPKVSAELRYSTIAGTRLGKVLEEEKKKLSEKSHF